MRKLVISVALFALLLAPRAFANHFADFYVIPVAIDSPGVNGTQWMSDVAIFNFQSTPLTVEMLFIASGQNNPDNAAPLSPPLLPIPIPAGGSVILKDVIDTLPGTTKIGAILIGANAPFAVTSRAYSMTPTGDTVGQTVQPARDFLENAVGDVMNPGATSYLPGLINNSRFRTNLGFVAATANNNNDGMTVEVTIRNASGGPVGTRAFFIPGGSFTHLQFASTAITGTDGPNAFFDAGSATYRITTGDGAVVPYASVIDNVTADAVFVTGQFPPNTPFAKTGMPSAFRQLFKRFGLGMGMGTN